MAVDASEMGASVTAPPAGNEGTVPPVTSAPPAAEAAPEASTPADDIWARVAELDPDELIRRHSRLQGKVGSLAQQQSEKAGQAARAEYQRELAAIRDAESKAARRTELQRLAVQDPDALATKVQSDIAAEQYLESQRDLLGRQQAQMDAALAAQLNGVYADPEVRAIWDQADSATKQKLDWNNHPTIASFFSALNEIVADHRAEAKATTKAEKLAQARFDALRKEAAVEGVRADAAAGVGSDLGLDGANSGEHIYTTAEITAMPMAEYRKVKDQINSQYRAGLIRR